VCLPVVERRFMYVKVKFEYPTHMARTQGYVLFPLVRDPGQVFFAGFLSVRTHAPSARLMRRLRAHILNLMPTYPGPTRKGFPNLRFGPAHPGVWMVCHLTAVLQLSHSHQSPMSKRVSIPFCTAELYRPICPSPAIPSDPSTLCTLNRSVTR
jgi:hypothetical protein